MNRECRSWFDEVAMNGDFPASFVPERVEVRTEHQINYYGPLGRRLYQREPKNRKGK
jgi:hypothetical protein